MRRMSRPVNQAFWFRIHYSPTRQFGSRAEIVVYTGTSLQSVLARIQAAQTGRLRYHPKGPRIVRMSALHPDTRDPAFTALLDAVLRLENTDRTVTH